VRDELDSALHGCGWEMPIRQGRLLLTRASTGALYELERVAAPK
jgi:hypothetical protein